MRKAIDLIEALFMLYGVVWGLLYYTGRLNYTGDKEERRKKRVEKFGWLIIIGVILMAIGGVGLLIVTFG